MKHPTKCKKCGSENKMYATFKATVDYIIKANGEIDFSAIDESQDITVEDKPFMYFCSVCGEEVNE